MSAAKPYHHGNLRATLLETAQSWVRQHGFDSLSLRQLATAAGVSHTAVYRHFRDKDQLLAVLAQSTFERMANRISYHSLKGLTPIESLKLGAISYLKYCLERPDEFRLLSCLDPTTIPAWSLPQEAMMTLVAACRFPDTDPKSLTLILMAQLHGLADLAIRQAPGFPTRKSALDLAAVALERICRNS